MPFDLAQAHAFDLARTLMMRTIIFETGERLFSVVTSDEFEGDPADIICEYDPFNAPEAGQ